MKTGVVKRPEDYSTSSARAHIFGRNDPLLSGHLFDRSELNEYSRFIRFEEVKNILEEIRKQTGLGKPFGDGGFIVTLSERIGCRLSFRSKGRPRRAK